MPLAVDYIVCIWSSSSGLVVCKRSIVNVLDYFIITRTDVHEFKGSGSWAASLCKSKRINWERRGVSEVSVVVAPTIPSQQLDFLMY